LLLAFPSCRPPPLFLVGLLLAFPSCRPPPLFLVGLLLAFPSCEWWRSTRREC
jgi:hypothetical protein